MNGSVRVSVQWLTGSGGGGSGVQMLAEWGKSETVRRVLVTHLRKK